MWQGADREGKGSLPTTLAPVRGWEGAGALAFTLQVHSCHQKPRGDLTATPRLQRKDWTRPVACNPVPQSPEGTPPPNPPQHLGMPLSVSASLVPGE